MNIQYKKFEMPPLKVEKQDLADIICKLLSNLTGFDFNSFLGTLSHYLIANKIGFDMQPNTEYSGSWQTKDKALVREIIWDFIIERYLTPGGNGHDDWPSLTVTNKGKDFFSSFK